ncbi:MAG TPA: hypothetical protein VLJ38_18705 [Polyangiaceae bacterium]|nr:hypothetical protein [Polyangiaceae bacterium]
MPLRSPPSRPALKLCVIFSTIAGASLLARPAHAEGYMYETYFGIGSGLEGGDAGTGTLGWQRARLRLSGGLDLRDAEDPVQGFGFRGAVELEKRGSIGGELRYSRWLGRGFGGFIGVTGTVAPETLLGGVAGATLVIPLGKRMGLFIEPSLSAFPLGSDLPGDSVLIWGLLTVGINVRL